MSTREFVTNAESQALLQTFSTAVCRATDHPVIPVHVKFENHKQECPVTPPTGPIGPPAVCVAPNPDAR